jgi:hypothetical protein
MRIVLPANQRALARGRWISTFLGDIFAGPRLISRAAAAHLPTSGDPCNCSGCGRGQPTRLLGGAASCRMSPSRLAVARETRQARQNHPEITRRVFGESAVGTSIIRAPFTSLHNPDHLIRVGPASLRILRTNPDVADWRAGAHIGEGRYT